jgi:simple sugar transport system ATP-binding protein
VLRDGSLKATLEAGATNIDGIARLMAGAAEQSQLSPELTRPGAGPPAGRAKRSATNQLPLGSVGEPALPALAREKQERVRNREATVPEMSPVSGIPVLEIRNLRMAPSGTEPALRDISISIGKGEIFGIGGVVGNGQRMLARVLCGKVRPDSGCVMFQGEEISRPDTKKRVGKNIGWLQENPTEEALLPERPIWENFLLGRQRETIFARAGFICNKEVIRFSEEQMELNNIAAPGAQVPLRSLSGGNRQKVALARVLSGPPLAAILEQPCRGLDLNAAGAIRDRMLDLSRSKGVSFIVISYDFDELLSICDRIAVIYRGEIMGTAETANLSREIFGRWAAGVKD